MIIKLLYFYFEKLLLQALDICQKRLFSSCKLWYLVFVETILVTNWVTFHWGGDITDIELRITESGENGAHTHVYKWSPSLHSTNIPHCVPSPSRGAAAGATPTLPLGLITWRVISRRPLLEEQSRETLGFYGAMTWTKTTKSTLFFWKKCCFF